jgi:predicted nucleotidyltransferase
MGVDLGDYDRDGDFDLVITNFSDEGTALFRNDGGLRFRDVAAAAGIAQASRPLLGWGVALADFDSDGWLDLYTSNGHVYPQADLPNTGSSYAQRQQLFSGGPGGRLTELPFPDARAVLGRASVRGDLDGDGDLDLVVLTLDGAPRLYVNRTDALERQLLVTLQDGAAPVFGATLTLQTARGPLTAQALSARGFQGVSDPRLHFGGGETIDAASVRWPGGAVEPLPAAAFAFGRHVTVARGRGVIDSRPFTPAGETRP